MIAWLIVIGYAVIWLLYGWRLTVRLLDNEVRRSPLHRNAREEAESWLGLSMTAGFFMALFWPVVAPVRGLYWICMEGRLFRTPIEREEEQKEELDRLRKLAREYNLPMGDR